MFPENGKAKLVYDLRIPILQQILFGSVIGRKWKHHIIFKI